MRLNASNFRSKNSRSRTRLDLRSRWKEIEIGIDRIEAVGEPRNGLDRGIRLRSEEKRDGGESGRRKGRGGRERKGVKGMRLGYHRLLALCSASSIVYSSSSLAKSLRSVGRSAGRLRSDGSSMVYDYLRPRPLDAISIRGRYRLRSPSGENTVQVADTV